MTWVTLYEKFNSLNSYEEIIVSNLGRVENLIKSHLNCFCTRVFNWRAWCKNGLRDDFGPSLTKPPNYLLSCNVTGAKWTESCSQHIVLVIWIEFPPKLYQVTLPLARKVKLPKCQEIPIISAGGKKTVLFLPLVDVTLKKKSETKLVAVDYLDRKRCSRNFLTPKWQILFYRLLWAWATFSDFATPSLPGSTS